MPLIGDGLFPSVRVSVSFSGGRKWKGAGLIAPAAAVWLATQPVSAQDLVWDSDSDDGGEITAGDGTWDVGSTPNWTDDDGATNTTFSNDASVEFTVTDPSPPPGDIDVTVDGTVQTPSMTFSADGFELSGNNDGIADIISATGGIADIILAGADVLATINTELLGTFNVIGEGTLVLTGDSGLAGLDISSDSTVVNTGTIGEPVVNAGNFTSTGTGGGAAGLNLETVANTGTAVISGVIDAGAADQVALSNTDGGSMDIVLRDDGVFTSVTGSIENTGTEPTSPSTMTIGSTFVDGSLTNGPNAELDIIQEPGSDWNVALTGDVTNDGDIDVVSGMLRIGVLDGGGVLTNNGDLTIGGGADPATLEVQTGLAPSTNTGALTVEANGTLDVSAGGLTNEATGTLNISGEMDGDLDNAGITNVTDGAVDGDIDNSGTLNLVDATIDGNIDTSGTVEATGGTIDGNVDNSGSFTGTGVDITGDFDNDSVGDPAATATLDGTIDGDVSNSGTGVLTSNGLDIGGDLSHEGTGQLLINADTTVGGQFTNAGTFNLDTADLTVDRAVNSGTMTIADGRTLTTTDGFGGSDGSLINEAGGMLTINGTLAGTAGPNEPDSGDLNNLGTTIATGATFEQDVFNRGTFTGTDFTVGDDFRNYSGTSTLNGTVIVAGVLENVGTLISNATLDIQESLFNVAGAVLQLNGTTTVADLFDNEADFTLDAADLTAGRVQNSGTMTVATGRTLTISDPDQQMTNEDDGTFNLDGTLDGVLLNQGTTNVTDGTITGDVDNNGVFNGTGMTVDGGFDNSSQADIAGSIGLDLDNTGTLTSNGLAIGGDINNSGGTMTVQADTTAQGDLDNQATLTVAAGTLTVAAATNTGTLTIDQSASMTTSTLTNDLGGQVNVDGTLNADLVNDGEADATGTVNGNVENNRVFDGDGATITGTVTNAGSFDGTDMQIGGDFDNSFAGTVNLGGNVDGTVTNTGGGEFRANGLTVGTDVVNSAGTLRINSATTVDGTLDNDSVVILTEADLTVGTMTNGGGQNGGVLIGTGRTLTAGQFTNETDTVVALQGTLSGNITNNGSIVAFDNSQMAGAVTNNGGISFAGNLIINGDLTNAGNVVLTSDEPANNLVINGNLDNDGVIDLGSNDDVSDQVVISGNLSGDNTFVLDIDLQNTNDPASDTVRVIGGSITGTMGFEFEPLGQSNVILEDPLIIVDADDSFADDFSLRLTQLPDNTQAVLYGLGIAETGDVFMFSQVNPAISAIVGNVALTQSLIGAVINRPSSPFVTGLAYQDEDPCGPGVWARSLAGKAETTGSTENPTGTVSSNISASYYGFQLGGDFACFNGHLRGWDVAVGGIAGFNNGTTYQPVFALDPTTLEPIPGAISSITNGAFSQYYGGVYAIAVRDRLAIDLQYRMEYTDFELSNEGVGGGGLGLTDGSFSSTAHTISGAASYSVQLGQTGFTVVPQAGFAYTSSRSTSLTFDDGSRLEVDDFNNITGFAGASVAWSRVAPSGKWAMNAFGTGTYYNDFTGNLGSTFIDISGNSEDLTSTNLGAYGEISGGVNFVRLFDPGDLGPTRQMSASIRADLRSGDVLDGWGVTGQVRFQF